MQKKLPTSTEPLNPLGKVIWFLLIVTLASLVWLVMQNDDDKATSAQPDLTADHSEEQDASPTIGTAWQWDTRNTQVSSSTAVTQAANPATQKTAPSRLSQEQVYTALKPVRLDEEGNIILDHEAKIALDAALASQNLDLEDHELMALQTLIKNSLPEPAGEQTAQLVANYYQFLLARQEFDSLFDGGPKVVLPSSNEDQQASDLAELSDAEAQYKELSSLRELYLGSEAAQKLFATEDANAHYMLQSFEINADTSLTEDEKMTAHARIQQQHEIATLGIENWQQRYNDYLYQKQIILDAGLDEQQKQEQISQLFRQHFNAEERARLTHLQLDAH